MEKSIKKNAVLNIIKVFMSMVFPLISFPYASRVLGPESVGKVDFSTSVIAYFVLFASLGVSTYGIREGAKVRDDKVRLSVFVQEIFIINLITTIIAYIVFFITIYNVTQLKSYVGILCISSLSIGFTTLGIDWLYGALEEYAYITVRSVIFQFISLLLLFVWVKTPEDYYEYAFVTVFATVGSNLMNFIHARKFIRWKKKGIYDFKRHIKPILTIFGLNLACNIYMNLDKTMVGVFCGDREVGLYSAAMKLNRVILQLILAIGTVAVARLSYYHMKGKLELFQQLFLKIFNYVLLLAIPATMGIFLLSRETLILLSGNEFIDATSTSKILSFIIVIIGMSNLMSVQVFIPTGRERYSLYASSAAAAVNFFLNMILIGKYGKNGAAVSTVIAEFVALVICIHFSKQIIVYNGVIKHIMECLIGALLIIPVYLLVNNLLKNSYLILFTTTILGGIVYGITLIFMKNEYILDGIITVKKIVFGGRRRNES